LSHFRCNVALDPILGHNGNLCVIFALVNSKVDVSFFAAEFPSKRRSGIVDLEFQSLPAFIGNCQDLFVDAVCQFGLVVEIITLGDRSSHAHFGDAVGISVRIDHSPAVMERQLTGVDVLQNGFLHKRSFVAFKDVDFLGRFLAEERFDHSEYHREKVGRVDDEQLVHVLRVVGFVALDDFDGQFHIWLVTELAYAEVFQIEDGSRLGHRRRGYVALSGARFNKREAVIEVILLPSRLQDPFKVDRGLPSLSTPTRPAGKNCLKTSAGWKSSGSVSILF